MIHQTTLIRARCQGSAPLRPCAHFRYVSRRLPMTYQHPFGAMYRQPQSERISTPAGALGTFTALQNGQNVFARPYEDSTKNIPPDIQNPLLSCP